MEDKLIRDLFVTGLTNQKAKEQLLATQTKTFEEAREIAQRLEAAVKLSSPIIQLKERLGLLIYVPQYKKRENHNKGGLCRECGKEHLGTQKRCLARNRNLIKCGLKGHFASQCPKADKKYQPSPGRRIERRVQRELLHRDDSPDLDGWYDLSDLYSSEKKKKAQQRG